MKKSKGLNIWDLPTDIHLTYISDRRRLTNEIVDLQ